MKKPALLFLSVIPAVDKSNSGTTKFLLQFDCQSELACGAGVVIKLKEITCYEKNWNCLTYMYCKTKQGI